jgi:hypothetical protein
VERGRRRPTIGCGDTNEDVIRRLLGVFGHHIEVAALVEHPGVREFKLRLVFTAAAVFFDESRVGKPGLRVLIERFHVGMRGR